MTQLQKLAWLNLVTLPLMVAVIVLEKLGILSDRAELAMLGLLLTVVVAAVFIWAKMPWHKGTAEDERDRQFRYRSFATAYFVLMGSLGVGLAFSSIAFVEGQIPARFLGSWIGLAGIASILAQSVALLVQYRMGPRSNFQR